MRGFLPPSVRELFGPENTINMDAYVDDCQCQCRSHFTVKDGLIHVHDRPIYDRLLVEGSLHIVGNSDLLRLPDFLAATDSIRISDCPNLKAMPSYMVAGLNIVAERLKVRDLPAFMQANDIVLDGSPEILDIGPRVQSVHLSAVGCSKLERFNADHDFGVLDLSETAIAELPANIVVRSTLKLRDCKSLSLIAEGAQALGTVDVRGCDALFTLPDSMQPGTLITDGMILACDWVVVPSMSPAEGGLCLGRKALEAFPHRHFKNLTRMQDTVVKVEPAAALGSRTYSVGSLKAGKPWARSEFLKGLVRTHLPLPRPRMISDVRQLG